MIFLFLLLFLFVVMVEDSVTNETVVVGQQQYTTSMK